MVVPRCRRFNPQTSSEVELVLFVSPDCVQLTEEQMAGRSPKKSKAAKITPRKLTAKPPARKKPVLLSGGNPQIAKGAGEAPVRAYIAAMPGWKRDIGRRLDAVITRAVPRVSKAVKWNSPFYGIEGQGWFLAFHCYDNYVKVTFFRGRSLMPLPPGESRQKDVRHLDVRKDDFDETQFASWVKQASVLPGERL